MIAATKGKSPYVAVPALLEAYHKLDNAAAVRQTGNTPAGAIYATGTRLELALALVEIGATTHAKDLEAKQVASVVDVNIIGVVNSVTAVLPGMVERGRGQLVAISSLAAYRGLPKSAAYSASKAAVSAFFESLRLDLYGSGVAVTIIHPGFIKTPLTAGRQAKLPWLLELSDAVRKILKATEARKKSYAFPWQLATVVRAGMIMPNFMYDWIARRNSFRE